MKGPVTLGGVKVPMSVLRSYVIAREGDCFAHKIGAHECPEWTRATLEHVTGVHGHLDGRHDDERHTVVLCAELNGGSMRLANHAMKEQMRAHLRELYPDCDGVA
jgi:hypothetical protein